MDTPLAVTDAGANRQGRGLCVWTVLSKGRAHGSQVEAEPKQLETAVALIVFNRPALTRVVFERVAQVRPRRLLLVADGPRPDRSEDHALCEEVRDIVTGVNWPCEVQTNFAPANLGCRARVISGLNWVFQQVEEAIILEDDILPDPSFFPFCVEMLQRFRHDPRIAMITGFNHSADLQRPPYSYFFSELTHVWGWASWREAWKHYDEALTSWPEVRRCGLLREVFPERGAVRYWTQIFDTMHSGTGPNTWDYQWMYTNLARHALSITPQRNLVQNIGFGAGGTHETSSAGAPRVSVGALPFPLQHPPTMIASRSLDALDQRLSGWHVPGLPKRIVRKAKRVLRQRTRIAP